jgi:hypothetical protein
VADPKPVTAVDIRRAIREHYGDSAAVFDEVQNGAGTRREHRSADCVAMGLWPSRGLHLSGIEIKVSRSDWQNELRRPSKAEAIAKYCDFWWLAFGDAAIVRDGELPENWGLMVMGRGHIKVVKRAPKLEPEPLDRGFIAALLRRAAEAQDAVIAQATSAAYMRGVEAAPALAQAREPAGVELQRLKESLAEFEARSGLKISGYDGPSLGDAVAKLRKLNRWNSRRADVSALYERGADELERQAKLLRAEGKNVIRELKLAAGVPLEEIEAEERVAG